MQKIISLFVRNYDGDRLVRDEIVPGAEWVIRGEGTATVKWDGTPCMIRNHRLFKRYDAKPGRTPPPGFEQSGEVDPVTGRMQGWVPVGDGPEDKWHQEAYRGEVDGAYELCGPKVQGNPYKFCDHVLIPHGQTFLSENPRTFEEIKNYLSMCAVEGLVWHHPDGRMVKIKARDFGIRWPR